MIQWWQSLSGMELIFAYVAIPATLLLLIQTILLLFGLGDQDSDFDLDPTVEVDITGDDMEDLPLEGVYGNDAPQEVFHGDSGLRLFTLRGLVAFFAVLGWTGLSLSRQGVPPLLTVALSLAAGFLALLLVAYVMKLLYKSQNSGNMELQNALGVSGTVYITIPPARQGSGKINLMLQGQYSELSAVTDHETPIATGTEVTVVGISGSNTLVIQPK